MSHYSPPLNHRKSPTLLKSPKHIRRWMVEQQVQRGVVPVCIFSECYAFFPSSGSYFRCRGMPEQADKGHERILLFFYNKTCLITEDTTHPFNWSAEWRESWIIPLPIWSFRPSFYWDHQSTSRSFPLVCHTRCLFYRRTRHPSVCSQFDIVPVLMETVQYREQKLPKGGRILFEQELKGIDQESYGWAFIGI